MSQSVVLHVFYFQPKQGLSSVILLCHGLEWNTTKMIGMVITE